MALPQLLLLLLPAPADPGSLVGAPGRHSTPPAPAAPSWPSELTPLAEGDFSDPRSVSINGSVFVSGTDYRRLLRFDGELSNASRTEFATTVDFVLDGVNFGAEVWAWTPYRHTDGSWHAYYTANAFEIMYAQPDPPTQQWTAAQPILKWKTVSKLISVKGACYYDNRIQLDEAGKMYLITNQAGGWGSGADVRIIALPMSSPSAMAADWNSSVSALLSPEVPKLNSERRDPNYVSIIENTQIQRIRNTYVLFYSVGDYALPNYKIGLAYSKSLLGPCECAALLPAADKSHHTKLLLYRLKGLHERYGQRLEQHAADAGGEIPHAVVGAVLARLHEPVPERTRHREPGQHDVQRTRAALPRPAPEQSGGAVSVEVLLPVAEAWGLGSRQRQSG